MTPEECEDYYEETGTNRFEAYDEYRGGTFQALIKHDCLRCPEAEMEEIDLADLEWSTW